MSHENLPRPEQDHLAPQFIDALQSVEHFNSKHASLGAAMTGILFNLIPIEDDEIQHDETVSRDEEAAMERELVRLIQSDELTAMGITLFDSEQPGIREFHKPKGATPSPHAIPSALVTFISDGDKFADTVTRLNPSDEELPSVTDGVSRLLSTMSRFVNYGYLQSAMSGGEDSHAARRIADDQLEMFAQLAPTIVKAGVIGGEDNADFNRLTEYAMRKQEGVLEYYAAAENQGLLAGEDRFGPAAWTMDMSGDLFVEKWTRALKLLKDLRGRAEQSSFYDELVTKLRRDFERSRKSLESYYGDAPPMSLETAKKINAHGKQRRELAQELNEKNGRWPKQEELENAGLPEKPVAINIEGEEYTPDSYIASLVEAIDTVDQQWEADFAIESSFIQE